MSRSVATLEDKFDSKRLEGGYVPTGWKGFLQTTGRAVKGHLFSLELEANEKATLPALLKAI